MFTPLGNVMFKSDVKKIYERVIRRVVAKSLNKTVYNRLSLKYY